MRCQSLPHIGVNHHGKHLLSAETFPLYIGVVNHATNKVTVYLFHEKVGPKNMDRNVSHITYFISQLPQWLCRIHLLLDNTCASNKNWYLMAWALEMLQHGKLDFLRVSFFIAGHTKFSPDLGFAKIAAKGYNRSKIFYTEELKDAIAPHADVVGEMVCDWRAKLTKLPGIRSLHDFLFAKNLLPDSIIRIRRLCYEESFENVTIHVLAGHHVVKMQVPMQQRATCARTS